MSQLSLAAELWSLVKDSIISSDRSTVADNIIAMLIDHDVSSEDIRREFRGEGVIIDALKFYIDADAEDWDQMGDDESDEIDYHFGDDDEDDDW